MARSPTQCHVTITWWIKVAFTYIMVAFSWIPSRSVRLQILRCKITHRLVCSKLNWIDLALASLSCCQVGLLHCSSEWFSTSFVVSGNFNCNKVTADPLILWINQTPKDTRMMVIEPTPMLLGNIIKPGHDPAQGPGELAWVAHNIILIFF